MATQTRGIEDAERSVSPDQPGLLRDVVVAKVGPHHTLGEGVYFDRETLSQIGCAAQKSDGRLDVLFAHPGFHPADGRRMLIGHAVDLQLGANELRADVQLLPAIRVHAGDLRSYHGDLRALLIERAADLRCDMEFGRDTVAERAHQQRTFTRSSDGRPLASPDPNNANAYAHARVRGRCIVIVTFPGRWPG